jgi:hypothetical protein
MKRTLRILMLVMLAAGCGRQARLGTPDTGAFQEAESLFQGGDYTRAADMYAQLLETESGSLREIALFRLALIEGLEGAGVAEAGSPPAGLRERFALEYPASSLGLQFETALAVLIELENLRLEQVSRQAQLEELLETGEVLRTTRERQMNDLEAIERELTRIREARAALSETPDDSPEGPESTSAESRTEVPSSSESPADPFDLDLTRLSDELERLIDADGDAAVASAARSMLSLLSEIRELWTEEAIQRDRVEELTLAVEALSEELEKLRAADMRRRLPD